MQYKIIYLTLQFAKICFKIQKYICIYTVNLLINLNILLSERETSYNSKKDCIKLHLMKAK